MTDLETKYVDAIEYLMFNIKEGYLDSDEVVAAVRLKNKADLIKWANDLRDKADAYADAQRKAE